MPDDSTTPPGKKRMTSCASQIPLKLRRLRDELRNHPGNADDYEVVGPDGRIIGRILRPFGYEGWQWNLFAVVRPPLAEHRQRMDEAQGGGGIPRDVGATAREVRRTGPVPAQRPRQMFFTARFRGSSSRSCSFHHSGE